MSEILRLEQVTKIYRSHEHVLLAGLGNLFDQARGHLSLRELFSPELLQKTYLEIRHEIEAARDKVLKHSSVLERAQALRELVFKMDEFAVTAVANVSFRVQAREFTALAGPSGSGKTTLLNLIAALEEPSDGVLYFEGRALGRLSEDERSDFRLQNLGFVFQAFNLIPVLSAYENIEYALILKGLNAQERRRRAEEALAFVGLSDCAHRRPNKLSGGQQQRVAIARALAVRPKLILADEPTANLDSKTAAVILDLMGRINQENGTTFIFSSHDPLVLDRARRVIFLRDGAISEEQNKTTVSEVHAPARASP